MDDYYEMKEKADAERFKWQMRNTEIDCIKRGWVEEDLREARQRTALDAPGRDFLTKQGTGPYQTEAMYQDLLYKTRQEQLAEKVKWDMRFQQIDDLKQRWLQEDQLEIEAEKRYRWVIDTLK